MTYAGARGETAAQMANTLHFDLPDEALHAAFNALDLHLTAAEPVAEEALSRRAPAWSWPPPSTSSANGSSPSTRPANNRLRYRTANSWFVPFAGKTLASSFTVYSRGTSTGTMVNPLWKVVGRLRMHTASP